MIVKADVSLKDMESLASSLAVKLRPGDVVTLSGEVGSGKTAFARALIGAIAPDAPVVSSPTFNLMQSYDVILNGNIRETLWHIDLYRLKHKNEAQALGLEELWSHVVIIEWPEIIEQVLSVQHLAIRFDFGADQTTRTLGFHENDAWRSRLQGIV